MKKSSLRFSCLFIILIFCLAPLSAIDLTQDTMSKVVDDDGTDSIAADDADSEVKTDDVTDGQSNFNGSGMDQSGDCDIEINGSSVNQSGDCESNETNQTFAGRSPSLQASIDDIYIGEVPVVDVYADKDLYGRISMECPDFEESYKVVIKDGHFRYQFHEDNLAPGTYDVKLAFAGDKTFDKQEITESFKVKKFDPDLHIESIGNVFYDEKVVVNINANKKLNDSVVLILNGSDEYSVDIVDGKGSITFDNLTIGKYQVEVLYGETDIFYSDKYVSSFGVIGHTDANFDVELDDIEYGQFPVLKIHTNKSLNGFVTVTTSHFNMTYEREIVNGYLEFQLPEFRYPGNYSVRIKYEGGDCFKPEDINKSFTVKKANPNLSVDIADCNMSEENLHVVVHADSRWSGDATVILNKREYVRKIKVVNGFGEGDYPRGDFEGNYTAVISTPEDEFFTSGNCSTTYIIRP